MMQFVQSKTALCIDHGRRGYGIGYTSQTVDGKTTGMHRQVYLKRYGHIPEGMVVRHTCNNPRCINPLHLLVGTHTDNMRDAIRARTHVSVRNAFTADKLAQAVALHQSGMSNRSIAKVLNVAHTTINKHLRGHHENAGRTRGAIE